MQFSLLGKCDYCRWLGSIFHIFCQDFGKISTPLQSALGIMQYPFTHKGNSLFKPFLGIRMSLLLFSYSCFANSLFKIKD